MMRAAVIFHRFGPYHIARLAAAGRCGEIVGIELTAADREYAWDQIATTAGFRRVTLTEDEALLSAADLAARLEQALIDHRPEVVFVPGWSGTAARAALRWCLRSSVPAVVMSESGAMDEPRAAWKEAVKGRIVRCFSAALVGGRRHRDYAVALGMPTDRVFLGYDAVDNAHFAAGADAVRADPSARERLGLPARFFLASNRFIPKKNLPGLLRAFAAYRTAAGPGAWELVLLGDGELRSEIERLIAELGLGEVVHLPGFKQYGDLPAYYGLAGAFIHASTSEQWGLVVNEAMAAGLPVLVSERCGCAPELVENGINGYTFDPDSPDELARQMTTLTADDGRRAEMGRASRMRVDEWGPERFAAGLWAAAAAARAMPRPRVGLTSRFVLAALPG